jgi:hypothetical protein
MAATGDRPAQNAFRFRWRLAILFAMGFGLPILAIVLWFLSDWPLTKLQFLTQVHGSAHASLAQNARELLIGLRYNFRFQPFFPYAVLAAIGLHLWHVLRKWHNDMPGKTVSIGLMLFMLGLICFLLRGSAGHLYYYPALVLAAMLLLASALPILRHASARAHGVAIVILFLILANNLAFIAAKTRTVWRNRDLLDPAPMNAFLTTELAGAKRCVLPPNLWLYGKQHQMNFRVNFLTLIGQSQTTYQAYLKSLLDWQPEVIIYDVGDAIHHQDRCFTPEQLTASGYVEQAHFNRVFRDRFNYDGYRLVVYRRVDAPAR